MFSTMGSGSAITHRAPVTECELVKPTIAFISRNLKVMHWFPSDAKARSAVLADDGGSAGTAGAKFVAVFPESER
jgi:hypothetical protein